MPDEVIAAIAVAITEDAGYAIVVAYAIEAAVVIGSLYASQEAQRRAQRDAKDAYNAALRDRYIMTRGATEARQIVLGRARVSGPMFFVGSYGANREHLTFMIALAAHEIDAVEQVYFDDMPVTLDGSGNVTGITLKETFSISASGSVAFTINTTTTAASVTAQAVYGTTIVPLTVVSVVGLVVTVSGATNGVVGVCEIRYRPNPSPFNPNPIIQASSSVVLDGSGNGSVTLAHTPVSPGVGVVYGVTQDWTDLTPYTSVVGTLVTVTGSPIVSVTATVGYQYVDATSRARVRSYLGASGQAADAATITNFPGIWTSADTVTGVAYLVVELDYDPTAFPSGIPNVSALIRGAKVLDPRTGVTAWSDNLALLMRHYATSTVGGRLSSTLMNDTSFIAAANVCDTSTSYIVNGLTYTRALYRGGITAKSDVRPQDVLNDIAQGMAGKWAFVDGLMRVKAGSFTTPVLTLDETWLHEAQQVHVQPKRARSDVINVVTATFADEAQSYQIVQMPRVAPATYITEDGTELPLDLTLPVVQFSGQAQHVAGCLLRDSRASIQLSVLCNMKAYPLELFDVINVTLSRFGWVNKTFEVQDINWTLDAGIQLSLKETDATVMAVGASFSAFDAGKATRLPSPFKVQDIAGLTITSGAGVMTINPDNTVNQRMLATWTAATDPGILDNNGGVEIRYGLATVPEAQWTSVFVAGNLSQAYLPGVQFDRIYMVKARGFNAITAGNWSAQVLHKVVGVPLVVTEVHTVGVSSVAVTNQTGVPDELFRYTLIATLTFTPAADSNVRLYYTGSVTYVNSTGSSANVNYVIADSSIPGPGAAYNIATGGYVLIQNVAASATIGNGLTTSRSIPINGGTAYTFGFYANKLNAGDTVTFINGEFGAEVTRR